MIFLSQECLQLAQNNYTQSMADLIRSKWPSFYVSVMGVISSSQFCSVLIENFHCHLLQTLCFQPNRKDRPVIAGPKDYHVTALTSCACHITTNVIIIIRLCTVCILVPCAWLHIEDNIWAVMEMTILKQKFVFCYWSEWCFAIYMFWHVRLNYCPA